MLRKILFQLHSLVGITLGTLLAFSGLTGGLMAFGPELTDLLSGANQKLQAQPNRLSAAQLHAKIQTAHPDETVRQLMIYDDPSRLARVQFALPPGPPSPTGPYPETHFANPYTGELVPAKAAGVRVDGFMWFLRGIHQGRWAGPGTISSIAATLIGLGATLLLLLALSGLYLRWPRGVAARRWSAWFKINWKLKGRAFLWSLHTVLGTCTFIVYLMIAHTGAFQNREMSWYANNVCSVLGMPHRTRQEPPGMRGGPPGGVPNFDGPRFEGPGFEGPGAGGRVESATDCPPGGFIPPSRSRIVTVTYMTAESYMTADATTVNAKSTRLDPATGVETPVSEPAPKTFGEKMLANNQLIHEGRLFGKVGVLIFMLAALALPVFYISGWMMYLQRRGRKRPVRADKLTLNGTARAKQEGSA